MNENYEAVIGLEVHAQLLTETKLFCGCSTKFGAEPNTNVCPVCLGHPGVLPVINKKAVEFTILMGLATNCTINEKSVFARKNYFYPDLPKGYQISQFEKPFCENGYLEIKFGNKKKKINIKRIHLEEDAGKSIHDQSSATLIDLNRCGVPLIEIVSEPDIRNAEEAYQYLSQLKQIVQYLEICDGNMEEGSLRCDANVSVRKKDDENLGTKTEVKNMNSFKNVEHAIDFEVKRQIDLLEDGKEITQDTLLWNADLGEAFSMRSKEEAHDYRYFPEPDLLPVVIDSKWKNKISKMLTELPEKRKDRFKKQYEIPEYDIDILTQDKSIADYYEELTKSTKNFKAASNWIMVDVQQILNKQKIEIKNFPVSPSQLGELINLIDQKVISVKIAKDVFGIMLTEKKNPGEIIKEKQWIQISDSIEIEKIIHNIISKNTNQVEEYLNGKEKVISFFIGQVMKETKGKANPQIVNELLKKALEKVGNK